MQRLTLFILVAVATLHALPSERELPSFDFDQYVIGGSDAKPNEFPWQLSLQYLHSSGEWRHTCGSSLLSPKYALTAAHCVDGRENTQFQIVAGLHKRSDTSKATSVKVKSFKIHEKYNDGTGTYSNDIAILTFEKDIKLSETVQAALLPKDNKYKFVNDSCTITGWGRVDASDGLPDQLQKGSLSVISNEECQEKIGSADIINGHVCVFDRSKKTSACNGDSGGPVSCKVAGKDTVVGVASWVIAILNKCRPAFPSAYTRVSEYLDWIKLNTP